ncbi:MAG: OsmC family protein [Thermomicrobiales bacterium]
MASEVKVKLVEGTTGIAIADGNAIVVDRSSQLGGTELGFKGGDLFLSSIGTCILTTLIGQARRKGVELTKVEFTLSGKSGGSPTRLTEINIDAIVEGDAPDEVLQELTEFAENKCFISNTVKEGAPINLVRRSAAEPAIAD